MPGAHATFHVQAILPGLLEKTMLHTVPSAGDVVRIEKPFLWMPRGSTAIIQGIANELKDSYSLCFADSGYRDNFSVSCSGGPVPQVGLEELIPTGETVRREFWRFKDGIVGPGRAEYYWDEVSLWSWTPGSARAAIDSALNCYRYWAANDGLHLVEVQRAARTLGLPVAA